MNHGPWTNMAPYFTQPSSRTFLMVDLWGTHVRDEGMIETETHQQRAQNTMF